MSIILWLMTTPLTAQLLLILTILLCQGCNAPAQSPISGHIEMHPEWKPIIYLVQPRSFSEIASNYLGIVIDSIVISADGKFAFENIKFTTESALLQLVIQKKGARFANYLADEIPGEANYMLLLFIKSNEIKIEADAAAFQKSFSIAQPSSCNEAILSLRTIRLNAFDVLQSETGEETEADSMLIEKEDAYRRYAQAMMDFADTTQCIEAAMLAIRWISPTGDFERIPEFVTSQCQKWKEKEPGHPYSNQLCVAADKNKLPVMVGDIIPDYLLPLVSGDTTRLSKILGTRLTLVDIWASWCAPCRKENKMVLAPLYDAYQAKGFQIIGYSIDNSLHAWNEAITKDKITWKQASHLSGDSTPFLEALHISTIPANFILDAEGNVIAKNLFGKDLTDFVNNRLGKR